MNSADKKMLGDIVKLAKAGNPRAVKALASLKKTGEIMGGDFIGSFLSSAFKYATMPITVPAKAAWKATKWTGRKLGITHGSASPEQVRLSKLTAARKRSEAAQARAKAADAETEAELRAQQAIASAADAEADAADAAALAKEAAMRTKEIEANPAMANQDDDSNEDSSGEFVGGWTEILGKDTKAGKIVAKAGEKSATGTKIRSGAKFYKKIASGDPKAKAALKTMIAKSNAGDQQAKRDLNAVWAGRIAVKAKEKAQKKEVAAKVRTARKLRVVAAQRKLESRIATKLVRTERKMQLAKFARVEAKAAKGNKKAIAYVAKQSAASKKGDKKAQGRIAAMQLGRKVRLAAPTKRERRNLNSAGVLIARARRNDPKAYRQIALIQAAAAKGNPNAKRALRRLEIAAAVASTVATGVVVTKAGKQSKQTKAQKATVASAKRKQAAGTGTREEYTAGARAAQALGDKATAGQLAVAASRAPSATESLKKTATVVAAKQDGNAEATAAIAKSFEEAKTGDPAAIKKMGNVVAVQTIDDINKGRPVSQTMQDAINLQQRAAAGDPAAKATLKTISEEAAKPNPIPEATAAAIASGAAVITVAALASKPKAKAEFMDKVNPPLGSAEKDSAEAELRTLLAKAKDGSITAEEGERGVQLAVRLGKPGLAAQISSMSPPVENTNPLSSLPDMPLAPITGVLDLAKETLKAFTFSTRDPLANYRGGVASRAKEPMAIEPVSSSGWSPFNFFKSFARNANIILPATGMVTSAATLAMALQGRKKQSTPAPTATPSVAPTAAVAPVQTVTQTPSDAALSAQPSKVEGETAKSSSETPDEIKARLRKEIAENILPTLPTAKATKGNKTGVVLGADTRSFKDYVTEAIKAKKMTKGDFNKAMDAHLPKKATKEERTASGEKVLKFLVAKGVKIEG
jgi:hypothetical protein